MIFVTIGSMFPFDRLIQVMDDWAARHPDAEVFAQIGEGAYLPSHMPYERMVSPRKFRELNEQAEIIVAHAGMGSVITAAELGKPIVLLPRHAAQKEHTTDHQIDTARWLRARPGIFVADTNDDIDQQIELARQTSAGDEKLPKVAPAGFTDRIRAALLGQQD